MRTRAMPASLKRRALAAGIETMPLIAIVGLVTFATFRRGRVIRLPRAALIVMLPAGVIARSWTLAERGATPGQRLVGLRVVDASTGQNLPFRRALVRTAVAQAPSLARIVFAAQRADAH